ncbi:MAG: hypothetical protein QM756_08840 [Polyangiaceae bacterium]
MAPTHRGHPGAPAYSPVADDVQNYVAPMPPPPPSRRPAPPQVPPLEASGQVPQYQTVDVGAYTPEPVHYDSPRLELPMQSETDPFHQPSRWRKWVKKPSREFMVRGAVAALALTAGWGIGAKPWKSAPAAHAVAAAKAPAHRAVNANKPAEQQARRVALVKPETATAAPKARSVTPPTSKPTTAAATAKTTTAAKTTTTKTAAAKTATPAKATAKTAAATKTTTAGKTTATKAATKPAAKATTATKAK